jgi:transcriptional regulator with XRE-family HTH domain
MNFKQATDLLSISLEQIASVVGKTYATVLAYRTGDRVPPPEVREKLAAFMRAHSVLLAQAADHLEQSGQKQPDGTGKA